MALAITELQIRNYSIVRTGGICHSKL